jgi:hypothetical protein
MDGLTEAKIREMVTGRWEAPSRSGFIAAWQELKDMSDLIISTGGQRWSIDQVQLKSFQVEE